MEWETPIGTLLAHARNSQALTTKGEDAEAEVDFSGPRGFWGRLRSSFAVRFVRRVILCALQAAFPLVALYMDHHSGRSG